MAQFEFPVFAITSHMIDTYIHIHYIHKLIYNRKMINLYKLKENNTEQKKSVVNLRLTVNHCFIISPIKI